MTYFRFFSDTNLDGFVQSIALFRREIVVDEMTRTVTVENSNDQIADLADQFGGVVLDV